MKSFTLLTGLIAVGSMSMGMSVSAASMVGWNNQGVGGVGLNTVDTAGASGFAQDNWNNHSNIGQAPGATPFGPLADDDGGVTGINVVSWSQSANNSWRYGETATPDQILLNDFSDTDPVVTFAGVNSFADDGYTVVVYYGNNEWNLNAGGTLDVNGSVQDIRSNDAFSVTGYIQNTDNGVTGSNYTVFTNISGDTLTVSLDAIGNDGISAIQIVNVPEPGSLALLGLGAMTLLRRRRR